LHNVAAGTLSVASTDAVNGSQLFATNQTIAGGGGGGGGNAVQYDTAAHTNVTLDPSGPAAGLQNVAAGAVASGSTDAVNGGQLFTTDQNVAAAQNTANTALSTANTAISVANTAQTTANAAQGTANTALALGQNSVQYDNAGHTSATLDPGGASASLHNVAAGTLSLVSTDAVNGSQLFATNQNVTVVQGTANTALALGQNSVQYDNSSHTSATLDAGGAAASLHNVADGNVAAGSTDAVNGGQLFVTDQKATVAVATANTAFTTANAAQGTANNALALGLNSVQYDNAGHTSVTLNPGGNPTPLHNVAAGVAPTDAANVSQLNGFGVGLKSNVFSGIAASISMGSAATPSAPGKTTLTLQSGFFENYSGVGIAFAHRLNTDMPIDIEGGFAHSGGENVGRVGLSIEF
jgi:autotransporter adhesin